MFQQDAMLGLALRLSVYAAAVLILTGDARARQDAEKSSDKLLTEVLSAWQRRESGCETLEVSWVTEDLTPKGAMTKFSQHPDSPKKAVGAMPPGDVKHSGRGQLYFVKQNCRISFDRQLWDTSTNSFGHNVVDAWLKDGICKTRSWSGDSSTPVGTAKKADWNRTCDVTTWPLLAAFRGRSTLKVIDGLEFDHATQSLTDGRRVVELNASRTEIRGQVRLLVDADRDYLPLRYETYGRDNKPLTIIDVRSQMDSRYGWIPASWSVSVFRETTLIRSAHTTVSRIAVNCSLPDNAVELEFPPGTYLFDYTGDKPRDFLIRSNKPPREVLPEERGASFSALDATESGELTRSRGRDLLARYWWTGLPVLLAAALFLAYRLGRR